jgi:thiol-disulfide isomerase/thioredoxin
MAVPIAAQQRDRPTIPVTSVRRDTMAPLTVLKFSSENCGTCHRISHYNARVVEEPDLAFVGVMLQDTATYRLYRKVLLACYSNKEGMGWPTYLVVSQGEEDFVIRGELRGGMPKGDFRERLSAVLASA